MSKHLKTAALAAIAGVSVLSVVPAVAGPRLCLVQHGKPTKRCIPVHHVRARGGDVTFQIVAKDRKRLLQFEASTRAAYDEIKTCIFEKANICFEGDFEPVLMCTTIHTLKGHNCLPGADADMSGTARLTFRVRTTRKLPSSRHPSVLQPTNDSILGRPGLPTNGPAPTGTPSPAAPAGGPIGGPAR